MSSKKNPKVSVLSNSKKIIVFFLAIAILGGALLFSLANVQNQGEKLVLYNNFAYYEQNVKLDGSEPQFELPYGIERDSITLKLSEGYVISQHINEANYTNEADILESYVGKEVSVFDENGKEINGTLIKYDGKAYVKTTSSLYIISPSYYSLPDFSGELKDENASVVFKLTSTKSDGRLSYLLDSISWKPDYTLYLNGNSGTLSLYGAITNNANDYGNVSLSLFYGQVKRATRGYYYPSYDYANGISKAAESAPSYTPSSVSEFYKFDLGNVNLAKGESKYNLFEKQVAQVRKTYEMQITGSEENDQLAIMLNINNSQGNGLGIALPSGSVRVIDKDGFVGEDYALETAKNEELRINTGNAFDVLGASKLVDQSEQNAINCANTETQYAPICVNEKGYIYATTYTYEATVKNKKSGSADVVLTFSPYGDWMITEETIPSEKVSQNLVKWKFTISPDSEKTLKFTITVKTRSGPIIYYAQKESAVSE